jgi:hypothetical protein
MLSFGFFVPRGHTPSALLLALKFLAPLELLEGSDELEAMDGPGVSDLHAGKAGMRIRARRSSAPTRAGNFFNADRETAGLVVRRLRQRDSPRAWILSHLL